MSRYFYLNWDKFKRSRKIKGGRGFFYRPMRIETFEFSLMKPLYQGLHVLQGFRPVLAASFRFENVIALARSMRLAWEHPAR